MSGIQSTFDRGLTERLAGPGHLRFIIQPLVAIILGVRDGLVDAKAGNPPYLMSFLAHTENRRELFLRNFNHVWKPFLVGTILDMIIQYLIFQRVRVWPALLVGLTLVGLPYAIARGLTNRLYIRAKHYRN